MPTFADLLGPERTDALRGTIAANTGLSKEEILFMTNTPDYRRASAADLGHDPDDVCVCVGNGAQGWTRRSDDLWVHNVCMRPTLEYVRTQLRGQRETPAQATVTPAKPTNEPVKAQPKPEAKPEPVAGKHRADVPVDSPSPLTKPDARPTCLRGRGRRLRGWRVGDRIGVEVSRG